MTDETKEMEQTPPAVEEKPVQEESKEQEQTTTKADTAEAMKKVSEGKKHKFPSFKMPIHLSLSKKKEPKDEQPGEAAEMKAEEKMPAKTEKRKSFLPLWHKKSKEEGKEQKTEEPPKKEPEEAAKEEKDEGNPEPVEKALGDQPKAEEETKVPEKQEEETKTQEEPKAGVNESPEDSQADKKEGDTKGEEATPQAESTEVPENEEKPKEKEAPLNIFQRFFMKLGCGSSALAKPETEAPQQQAAAA